MTSPATFSSPAGWAERCTMRDDSLDHQIHIIAPTAGKTELLVSCNCRKGQTEIAKIDTCEQAWIAYNGYHDGMDI